MRKAAVFLILFCCSGALWSCRSQIPVAETYPATGQKKMQAAHHWDVLANDVAGRVEDVLDERDDLSGVPLDVEPAGEGVFHEVFAELLKSRLVSRGLPVAARPEGAMALASEVRLVRHNSRFQRPPPGLLTAVGTGIAVARDVTAEWLYAAAGLGLLADVGVGYLTTASDVEVVISSSLVHRNRYVMHTSDVYYINEPDADQYRQADIDEDVVPLPAEQDLSSVKMGVVND
jgi:hypothetical protein